MDHISDSFLETNVPLLVLIEAAKSGNEKEVKEYAQVFREHANKLVEVSHRPGDSGFMMQDVDIYSVSLHMDLEVLIGCCFVVFLEKSSTRSFFPLDLSTLLPSEETNY